MYSPSRLQRLLRAETTRRDERSSRVRPTDAPEAFGRRSINRPRFGVDFDAIEVARRLLADIAIHNIEEHPFRLARRGIAIASAARWPDEDPVVTIDDHTGAFARDVLRAALRANHRGLEEATFEAAE